MIQHFFNLFFKNKKLANGGNLFGSEILYTLGFLLFIKVINATLNKYETVNFTDYFLILAVSMLISMADLWDYTRYFENEISRIKKDEYSLKGFTIYLNKFDIKIVLFMGVLEALVINLILNSSFEIGLFAYSSTLRFLVLYDIFKVFLLTPLYFGIILVKEGSPINRAFRFLSIAYFYGSIIREFLKSYLRKIAIWVAILIVIMIITSFIVSVFDNWFWLVIFLFFFASPIVFSLLYANVQKEFKMNLVQNVLRELLNL